MRITRPESQIILELNQIRQHPTSCEKNFDEELAKFFDRFSSHPSVKRLNQGLANADFDIVRAGVESKSTNLILSRFSVPYNPSLTLDGIWFERIPVDPKIRRAFPSSAKPIRILDCTDGFKGPRAVALFPENFKSRIPAPAGAPVFYFIEKFVDRFERITRPFLMSGCVDTEPFSAIISLSRTQVLELASAWVVMHEHFHDQGTLPLKISLAAKSSRSSAGLEELRVDLLSIIAARSEVALWDSSFGEALSQFILAERLLRYPLEALPSDDYDARSSILLACLLRRRGVLTWADGKLRFTESFMMGDLQSISTEISELEHSIRFLSKDVQKKALNEYVRENGLTDGKDGFLNLDIYLRSASHVA